MAIYRCPIDNEYSSYESLKQRHVVAQGWSGSDDVSFFIEESDIGHYLPVFAERKDLGKVSTVFNVLTHEAHAGDIFIATVGGEICGICELPENFTYVYLPNDEYANCLFPVNWVDWSTFCPDFTQISNPRSPGPLTHIGNSNVGSYVNEHWASFKSQHSITTQPMECQSDLEKYLQERPGKIEQSRNNFQRRLNMAQAQADMEALKNLLLNCHNLILTGAPGTGKTHLAMALADALTKDKEDTPAEKRHSRFVQFHPSYDYADFVEGLRPTKPDENGNIGFVRQDGTFKAFCKRAIENQSNNFKEAHQCLLKELIENHSKENPLELKTDHFGKPFKVYRNSQDNLGLITGNSTDNQGSLTAERIESFLTSSPYPYWEGYYKGVLNYLKDNFKLNSSSDPKDQKYVFIIDEINRGDIAKIFGELFFALDPGYRGKKEHRVMTQYSNLIEDGDVFKDGFYIPDNVYVIGTMNDIDRNVESMDFAIRRRFTWKMITPEDTQDAIFDELGAEIKAEAIKRMNRLNTAIRAEKGQLGENFCIGAAYFAKVDNSPDNWDKLWKYHLEPLLEEYVRSLPESGKLIIKFRAAYYGIQADVNTAAQ